MSLSNSRRLASAEGGILGEGLSRRSHLTDAPLLLQAVGGSHVASATLGSVTFVAAPLWHDAALRTPSEAVDLVPPSGAAAPSVSASGFYLTLPSSPVYAGEEFSALLFASTHGYPANSWRLKLFFNSSLLEYRGFGINSKSCPPSAHAPDTPCARQQPCSLSFLAVRLPPLLGAHLVRSLPLTALRAGFRHR